ncbi:MAG: hypothetical protein M1826_001720 [Phylliscum demangeonii]|nr:MAG: hypothetical protein M1826_001720 [Phylliscum demangeonii]
MADSEPVDVDMTEAPRNDDPAPRNDKDTGGRHAARKHWKALVASGKIDLDFKSFMAQPTIQDSQHAPPPAASDVPVEASDSVVPVVRLPPVEKLKRKRRRAEPSEGAERPSKTRTKSGPPSEREMSTPTTGPTPLAPLPLRPRRAKKDRTTQEDDGQKKGSEKTPAKAAEEPFPRRLEKAVGKAKRAEHLFVTKPRTASKVTDMDLLAAMYEFGEKQNVRLGVTSLILNDKGGWLGGFESPDAAQAALNLNPVFTVGKTRLFTAEEVVEGLRRTFGREEFELARCGRYGIHPDRWMVSFASPPTVHSRAIPRDCPLSGIKSQSFLVWATTYYPEVRGSLPTLLIEVRKSQSARLGRSVFNLNTAATGVNAMLQLLQHGFLPMDIARPPYQTSSTP